MEQVAEFMEEGRDVEKLHDPWVALDPARKVADQGGLGELKPGHAGPYSKLRRVIEFPQARVEIQEEPPQELLALPDLVRLDAGVPNRGVIDLLVRHPEELRGDVEETLLHAREGEVGACRLSPIILSAVM